MTIIHNVQQGSPEWHALRATTRNASEAPAMMGVSPYKSRSALVAEKATGIKEEISAEQQRRFDKGHEAEAKARVIVEELFGEDLYPLVATDDYSYLLASSDGATMMRDWGFEHKLWNAEFAAQVAAGEVPESHKWQLDQQIEVFGFEKILFVVSDGTKDNFVHCWYTSTPERAARLRAGWQQFDKDVAAYTPEVAEAKPILTANPIDHLPALVIEVTGRVTHSNLAEFKAAAAAVIGSIKTELVTDQDFVDATAAVKYLKEVEDNAKRAKQHALDQTTSIAELHRALDDVAKMAADVRKALDKKITEEKESRKESIVLKARNELAEHCRKLNARIGGFMPAVSVDFAGAIKGMRSLDNMAEEVSKVLRDAQYEASQVADRIESNIKLLDGEAHSWRFLFPDLAAVCAKAPDDFAALLASRQASHRAAEEKRLEQEREQIRAEEQAKAQREANERAAEEIRKLDAERKAAAMAEAEKLAAEAKAAPALQSVNDAITREFGAAHAECVATGAAFVSVESDESGCLSVSHIPMNQVVEPGTTIKLGEISQRLGFTVSADFLASLGFEATTEKNAKLYPASQWPTICRKIADHVLALAFKKAA